MPDSSEFLFYRWFTSAVNVLRLLPRGDGGIAAFMITLPLVERAAIGRLKLRGKECGKDNANVKTEIGVMLGLTDAHQRSVFWDMFRNGFMHLGMPLDGKTKWLFSGDYGNLPVFQDIKGTRCICLDPWKFADYILGLYHAEPKLITASESAPFGDIFFVES
jgi:hypothetical protein